MKTYWMANGCACVGCVGCVCWAQYRRNNMIRWQRTTTPSCAVSTSHARPHERQLPRPVYALNSKIMSRNKLTCPVSPGSLPGTIRSTGLPPSRPKLCRVLRQNRGLRPGGMKHPLPPVQECTPCLLPHESIPAAR